MHSQREFGPGHRTGGVHLRTWLIFLISALVVLPAGCGKRRIKETPAELIGVWRTSAEDMENASMQFTDQYLVIGRIDNSYANYALNGFVLDEIDEGTDIKIYYVDSEGYELSMQLLYTADDGGTLIDQHQPALIWKKEPS